MRTGCRWSPARLSAWPPRAPELAPLANDRTPVSERPRAVRLLRQVAAAAILQADLEHPAPRGAARSDRLLDPAPLHPDRDCDLAPRRAAPSAESHRPGRRHSSGPRPGHARATSWFHPTRQARWAIAGHDQPARGRRIPSLRHRAHHELLETALCHGWVDTQPNASTTRAMPSASSPPPGSNWSATNREPVRRLQRQGRMTPAGEAVLPADL
jgi:hypothetical protein